MTTSIYKVEVKLNPSDDYTNYVLISNEYGHTLVDVYGYISSFTREFNVYDIRNKQHIKDIEL